MLSYWNLFLFANGLPRGGAFRHLPITFLEGWALASFRGGAEYVCPSASPDWVCRRELASQVPWGGGSALAVLPFAPPPGA